MAGKVPGAPRATIRCGSSRRSRRRPPAVAAGVTVVDADDRQPGDARRDPGRRGRPVAAAHQGDPGHGSSRRPDPRHPTSGRDHVDLGAERAAQRRRQAADSEHGARAQALHLPGDCRNAAAVRDEEGDPEPLGGHGRPRLARAIGCRHDDRRGRRDQRPAGRDGEGGGARTLDHLHGSAHRPQDHPPPGPTPGRGRGRWRRGRGRGRGAAGVAGVATAIDPSGGSVAVGLVVGSAVV